MITTVPVKILNPESTIRYLPVLLYVLGLSTILLWVVINTGRGVSALLHAKDVFAEQADRRLWAEQALRHRLSEDHTSPELERFGREIASTIKQHEKDGTLIGLMTIVGGAITALGATPPFRTWQTNDTLTLAVSSLILGAGIAAIAKHGFIQYLMRVESAVAEAVKAKGTSIPLQL